MVPRTASLLAPRGSARAVGPLQRLAAWPAVATRLARGGVDLGGRPGEGGEALENRIGTALMALWRDTRSHESFEALYAFARPAVLAWIQGLLSRNRSHLDPAELLQDTFVNVYRYPSAFRADHPGSFRVWVRTIAGNIVRRASAQRHRLSFQELPDGLQEPEDRRGGPLHHAEIDEERAILGRGWTLFLLHYARAFEELSERDQQALRLVEVEGCSYREAGRILAVGRSNMKMIVFRARLRIARHMHRAMGSVEPHPCRDVVLGAA